MPAAVVFNEAQFPEPIHEEADTRSRCADHFGEGFLAHFRDEWYRLGFLAKVGHQQQKPSEAFFAGVEEMIHQVRFHANVPGKQVGQKAFGKFRFADGVSCSITDFSTRMMVLRWSCASSSHAKRLARQTALAKETAFRQDSNDSFFALLGHNGELHLAALHVKHRIRSFPLRKNGFTVLMLPPGFSSLESSYKGEGVECGTLFS